MRSRFVSSAAGLVLVAALFGGPRPGAARAEGPPAARQQAEIELEPVVDGLERPVHLTHAGDGSGRLFVVEKEGRIRVLEGGQLRPTPFLDIEDRVEDGGNEQGLLSVAFHPDYEENGRFFVYYTSREGDGMIVIAEYGVSAGDPNVASRAERRLLTIPHPSFENHNGGLLKFGPDGYLYAGVGDGGGANDPGPGIGNAQNLLVLLGKILRLDVDSGGTYTIPDDNPFAHQDNARGEIWAYGFRNPWRYSFDRQTGELWVADVGQNQWEEVDVVRKGGNYGWRVMEGFHCRPPATTCDMTGLELPVFEYSHGGSNGVPGGCSITGGYVYRGSAIPSLAGVYLFADYCGGSGELYAFRRGDERARVLETGARSEPVTSFGEDEAGELYVVTDSSFGGQGTVFRLVLAGGACDLGCGDDVTAVDADGDGSEAVDYDPPAGSGECGVVTCTPAPGAVFPVGTTEVTCESSSGGASCSFSVVVTPEGGLSVASVDPPGSTRKRRLQVTITGTGFLEGATVSFGKKIKVRSVTVVSPTEIVADIKVNKAKRGPRDVVVTNPGGASATGAGLFTVE